MRTHQKASEVLQLPTFNYKSRNTNFGCQSMYVQLCLSNTHWGAQNINASASYPMLVHACGLPLKGKKSQQQTTLGFMS